MSKKVYEIGQSPKVKALYNPATSKDNTVLFLKSENTRLTAQVEILTDELTNLRARKWWRFWA